MNSGYNHDYPYQIPRTRVTRQKIRMLQEEQAPEKTVDIEHSEVTTKDIEANR